MRLQGVGFIVQGAYHGVRALMFAAVSVWGAGFRVQGLGCGVQGFRGLGFRV